MILSIELKTANIIEAVARESAIKAQLLTDNPAAFERMTVTEGDHTWLTEKILQSAKVFTSVLHPYIDNHIFTDTEFAYELLLEDTFNEMQGTAVLQSVREAITKTVTAEWFRERGQVEIANTLLQEYAALIDQIKALLYKWRVERSEKPEIIKEAIVVEEGGVSYNYLVIGVPHEAVLEQTKEDVNTTLKSTLSSTDEYEKYKISNIHNAALLRTAKKGLNEVAENSYGYAVEWRDHVLENAVLSKVATLKGTAPTEGSSNPYYMLVLRMPSTFNEESINPIAESFESVLVSKSIGEYFVGVGLHDPSKHYFLQEEKALLSIKEVLYQWRVVRRQAHNDITHAIIAPDGTRKAMFVVIGIASENVINLAAENVNASLKARLPGTEEYEKFRITETELTSLERLADEAIDVIAMRAQAYMSLWKQDASGSEVQSVINEIKGEEGDVIEDTTPHFLFVLKFPENFNTESARTIASAIKEIISNEISHRYFMEVGLTELSQFCDIKKGNALTDLMALLYKWRVVRSLEYSDITHAITVPDGTRKAMFVVIGIARDNVINLAAENMNAALKARLPGTEEYEKFRITETELISLERLADKVADIIAIRAQAYMALWRQNVPVSEVQSVINEIKGGGDVSEDTMPHFLFVFKLPENFNAESARTIASAIKEVISNEISHIYFVEVGHLELSQFYDIKKDNALTDLMSLLHRRTKPIRRRGNFFN